MDAFELARELYRRGRELIDATRDRAVVDDTLRWAREDLEDALLDLKRSVLGLDAMGTLDSADEVAELMSVIRELTNGT